MEALPGAPFPGVGRCLRSCLLATSLPSPPLPATALWPPRVRCLLPPASPRPACAFGGTFCPCARLFATRGGSSSPKHPPGDQGDCPAACQLQRPSAKAAAVGCSAAGTARTANLGTANPPRSLPGQPGISPGLDPVLTVGWREQNPKERPFGARLFPLLRLLEALAQRVAVGRAAAAAVRWS